MPLFTQVVRPLRVTTPLGPDALLLVGLSGHEAISRLFQFRLDLMAENETAVPFEKLLGQKVVVELGFPDQDVRYISGICSRVGQAGRDPTFTAYHLELVPQLWFLTRIAQSRIFQQKTVPEILGEVLKSLDVQFQLTGQYEPRDYCVQYRETDFNFASRLMEEEGIFYFFRHAARGHTLIVADSPQSFPELPEPLLFDEAFSSGNRDEERIGSWEKSQELRSGKVTLWDHCFELPHKHLEAEKTIQDSVVAGTVTHKLKLDGGEKLELYNYPGEYAQRFDGVSPGGGDRPGDVQKIFTDNQRTVALRMQEEAAAGLVIHGSGNVRALTSGSTFELAGHFDADGSYLLTGVEHTARLTANFRSGDPEPFRYASSFTCLPAALPFRPARSTPKPVVQGTQTAVVVGPSGEEIWPDKYSRVKVQFHWDRQGQNNPNSSCWIRVGTPWAGRQWGMIHIPRIGQEVIVAFQEGDPDQPIIVGSVYNADMMPPYTLPENKTQSGVKSRSSPQGTPQNFNEIRFEDKKGKEEVHVHAERNLSTTVEADESRGVGHDRSTTIGHDDTLTVKNKHTVTVKEGPAQLFVDANGRVVIVKEQYFLLAKSIHAEAAEEYVHVKAPAEIEVNSGKYIALGIGETANYILIKNSGDVAVSAASKIEAGVTGNTITITKDGKIAISAGVEIELKVGDNSIKIDSSGITLKGAKIKSSAVGVNEVVGSQVKLNCK